MGQDGDLNSDDSLGQGVVPVVVDLIGKVKAGLMRRNRPIASLMFIGPTGVGKTETAKALAEFLYNDPKRMIRIDMSEYSDPFAVDRLINGLNSNEGVLTAQVRAQPFGIVLLDEFEKASSNVFDLLLQMLGEGRLTDSNGKLADFRNSVIILTSNLGVEGFGKQGVGFDSRGMIDHEIPNSIKESQDYFTEQIAELVRPELLNRIDQIIPFQSLSRCALRKILDKELHDLKKRFGMQIRKLKLHYEDEVLEKVLETGYQPKYGARPLRRAIESLLLSPLAKKLIPFSVDVPFNVFFTLVDGKIHVELEKIEEENKTDQNIKDQLSLLTQLRFDVSLFLRSPFFTDLQFKEDFLLEEDQCRKKEKKEQLKTNPENVSSKKQKHITLGSIRFLYSKISNMHIQEMSHYLENGSLDPLFEEKYNEFRSEFSENLIYLYAKKNKISNRDLYLQFFYSDELFQNFWGAIYQRTAEQLGGSCSCMKMKLLTVPLTREEISNLPAQSMIIESKIDSMQQMILRLEEFGNKRDFDFEHCCYVLGIPFTPDFNSVKKSVSAVLSKKKNNKSRKESSEWLMLKISGHSSIISLADEEGIHTLQYMQSRIVPFEIRSNQKEIDMPPNTISRLQDGTKRIWKYENEKRLLITDQISGKTQRVQNTLDALSNYLRDQLRTNIQLSIERND